MADEDGRILSLARRAKDELLPEKDLEMMAVILLRGYRTADGRMKCLSKDIEGQFRKALVWLLRSNTPLSRNVRDALSDVFAVDDEMLFPRTIEFGFRQKGNRSDPGFVSNVAAVVEEHLIRGDKVDDGIQAAVQQFGLDERTVKQYWSRYAKALGLKMPPGRRPRKKHT
jgi:hypothetical protein